MGRIGWGKKKKTLVTEGISVKRALDPVENSEARLEAREVVGFCDDAGGKRWSPRPPKSPKQ